MIAAHPRAFHRVTLETGFETSTWRPLLSCLSQKGGPLPPNLQGLSKQDVQVPLSPDGNSDNLREDPGGDGNAMEVDKAFSSKDPYASRESHKFQRALQAQRRASKPHSTVLTNAKSLWSLARQKNISSAERKKHILALMAVIRGKVHDIVFMHDASRIIQTIVKYGGQQERDEVAMELKGRYKELAQHKYSKFLVTKLIRLCPTHRISILLEFQSHVLRLLLHREASSVIAEVFELYANAYERSILLRDFYGKEATLFMVTMGSQEDKERAKKGLKGVLEGLVGERRKRVLTSVKDNLKTIFNNPDKGAVTHAIVHRILWEYLVATQDSLDEAERAAFRTEMLECCQDSLAEIVHTKDGSRVAREFLAQGNAKDRKQIVKVLKPHIKRMCEIEEAQLVLFTALDVIDDTKLTAKSLVLDIVSHANSLYRSPQGRRALLYLLVPRSRRHFTPAQIRTITETDSLKAKTSKKHDDLRECEVRKAASEGLLTFVAEEGGSVARDTGGSLLITEIMLYALGDKNLAIDSILTALMSPYPSEDPARPHSIDLPHASRMYKTLLQGGHFSRETKSISPPPSFSAAVFASAFLKVVGKDLTLKIAKGNGAFIVAELCQRILAEGTEDEKKLLKGYFEKSFLQEIGENDIKGKQVLLEKVATL